MIEPYLPFICTVGEKVPQLTASGSLEMVPSPTCVLKTYSWMWTFWPLGSTTNWIDLSPDAEILWWKLWMLWWILNWPRQMWYFVKLLADIPWAHADQPDVLSQGPVYHLASLSQTLTTWLLKPRSSETGAYLNQKYLHF